MKIGLIEPYIGGHHTKYAQILAAGLVAQGIPVCLVAPEEIQSGLDDNRLLERIVIPTLNERGVKRHWKAYFRYQSALGHLIRWKATHVHFLYGDWSMLTIVAAILGHAWKGQYIVTAHWLSGIGFGAASRKLSWFKRWLHLYPSRYFMRMGGTFAVHDEDIYELLSSDAQRNDVVTIPYPIFPIQHVHQSAIDNYRKKLDIPSGDVVLLCFGDTRYDKGVDLAVRAFLKLPSHYHLLIAGKSVHFSIDDIKDFAKDKSVFNRIHCLDRFIPDDEVSICFGAADLVLLPYRKSFSGQSGPLTLGAGFGKPIVAARIRSIEKMVLEYSLGTLFEAENVNDMAYAIEHRVKKVAVASTELFQHVHSHEKFIETMTDVYRKGRVYDMAV